MEKIINNTKGITTISIVITIVILTILGGITIYVAQNLMSSAEVENITTDLLLIQAKCKIVSEKTNFDSQTNNLKGTKLTAEGISSNIQNLFDNGIILKSEISNYYILSQEDLNNMGLDKLNANDGYIVNYQTQEVIFAKGVVGDDGKTKYRLSDMTVENDNVEKQDVNSNLVEAGA